MTYIQLFRKNTDGSVIFYSIKKYIDYYFDLMVITLKHNITPNMKFYQFEDNNISNDWDYLSCLSRNKINLTDKHTLIIGHKEVPIIDYINCKLKNLTATESYDCYHHLTNHKKGRYELLVIYFDKSLIENVIDFDTLRTKNKIVYTWKLMQYENTALDFDYYVGNIVNDDMIYPNSLKSVSRTNLLTDKDKKLVKLLIDYFLFKFSTEQKHSSLITDRETYNDVTKWINKRKIELNKLILL